MKTCFYTVWTAVTLIVFPIFTLGMISGCDHIGLFYNSIRQEEVETSAVQTQWIEEEEESLPNQKNETKVETKEKTPIHDTLSNERIRPADSSKKSSAQYSVQVGAFLNEKNATSFITLLKKKGYQIKLVRLKSKNRYWHAVRLSKFTNEKLAIEKANEISNKENIEVALIKNGIVKKIIRSKQKKSLTNSKSVRKNQKGSSRRLAHKKAINNGVKKQASTTPKMYSFQVGGYLKKENAEKQVKKLLRKGYKAFIVETPETADKEIWSTVQVGYYDTLLEADKAAITFFNEEKVPAQARHIYDFHQY